MIAAPEPCMEITMTIRLFALALSASLVAPTLAAAQSSACAELWYQRNSIYKEGGYCFRTARAISVFGNAGCAYDDVNDVPLSARQRAEVNRLQRAERALRCPR
jgi:hypothetical protein